MANLEQPEIAKAFEDIRSNKSDTNWLVLKYESARSDKLILAATGTGGLADLGEGSCLGEGEVVYAFVRVAYANDKESKREKFILISWIGKEVKGLRRAKVSVHLADVKKVLHSYAIDVSAQEVHELAEELIVARLRKAGGASYDGV